MHIACVDFPSRYFQALLHPDSQKFTAFNTEFGRFLFLRAPQGLSSSGDHFNCTTDQFYSGLGDWLIKQVDDMYIIAKSMRELRERLEIAARESIKRGVTWSISKFFAGREVNIVSGHQVTLDPSGVNPPEIGPDPARVKKLADMQPPENQKQVRSFLGLVNQLGKFSPDYAMITTKIRGLLKNGVKFDWTPEHELEFRKVIESLSDLEKLAPYNPENDLFALVDASLMGLGFILFQKDANGKSSILQAGSTSLKHAQVRWAIPELELLSVKYMLNKCHFYTAWASKPIIIYSDCQGLKNYQTRDIADIDNKHLFSIKSDLMAYNYEIKHVKGETNCIADCLSRRPEWMKNKGRAVTQRDEVCLRVITESRLLLKDNPALKKLEEIGKKDSDYQQILSHIRAGKNFRDLPDSSEGSRMEGEWPRLAVMEEFDIIVLRESESNSKIFPPKKYRPLILEELHKSGRKEDSVCLRVRTHYTWPSIRKDVKAHIDSCKLCAELMPSKSQARSSGLSISMKNLRPMDWLSTDLAQKTLPNGRKINFLIIVDRVSGFIKVYKLKGTKIHHVIEALQDFNDCYAGPPYWLTSDGGPQFSGANAVIQKWAEEASIQHTISAAFNPEGNGEAEKAVQAAKKAISHSKDDSKSIQSIVANLNHDQRVNGSGSPAECFLQCTTRVPGLAHLPTQPRDTEKLRADRASSRDRQVKNTQSQRRPEVFVRGQPVLVQNNLSTVWT